MILMIRIMIIIIEAVLTYTRGRYHYSYISIDMTQINNTMAEKGLNTHKNYITHMET